jgi:hypothetical protein
MTPDTHVPDCDTSGVDLYEYLAIRGRRYRQSMQRQYIGLTRSIDGGRAHQLGNRICFRGTCRPDGWQRHEYPEGSECDHRFR